MGSIWRVLFYQPTFNILIVLYNFFASNLGLAIVGVAALSRLVTYPITRSQIRFAKKSREFQDRQKKVKEKYRKNKEKQNEELMKLQAEYLPGQLAGCLPIIVLIILLLQVRSGIRNLVDQGWHAFNDVAYTSSLKRDEDFIKFKPSEDLELGEHTLKVDVRSEGGESFEKEYKFEIVDDIDERKDELKEEEKQKSAEEQEEEQKQIEEEKRSERETDISLYSQLMEGSRVHIPVSKFLIFTTRSLSAYLMEDEKPEFEIYIRPPSNQKILSEEIVVLLDEVDVTRECQISQGDPLNLEFIGIDLSKTASDFSWSDKAIIPYAVLAVLVGLSQLVSTQILTGIRTFGEDKKKQKKETSKKKQDKKDEEMPDMAEMMSMANKQMMFMFPVITVLTSLGYMGGSNIFPSGISVFWTVQSLFVIIQQLLMNRKKAVGWLRSKLGRGE